MNKNPYEDRARVLMAKEDGINETEYPFIDMCPVDSSYITWLNSTIGEQSWKRWYGWVLFKSEEDLNLFRLVWNDC